MKEKFYKVINFLNDIHLVNYTFYLFCVAFAFYLVDRYSLPFYVLEKVIFIVLLFAFMNTWELESYKYNKKKESDNNDKIEK